MTTGDQIVANIVQDSTTAEAAEAYLRSLGLNFEFIPKSQADRGSPKFQWRSPAATGYIVARLPERKIRWSLLAYEQAMARIEVDEHGMVTQVVIKKYFTGM